MLFYLTFATVVLMEDVEYIKVTKETLSNLLKHKKRTGFGPYAIMNTRKEAKPDGLNGEVLSRVLKGLNSKIRADHLDYVLNRYKSAPDKPVKVLKKLNKLPYEIKGQEGYIKVSPKVLEELRKHKDDGLTVSRVLSLTEHIPHGFSFLLAQSWMTGRTKNANSLYLNFYLDACRNAAKHPQRPIIITKEMHEQLLNYKDKSGVGGTILLKNAKDIPPDLHGSTISSWLSKNAKTARKDHWDYVINEYKRFAK